MPAPVMIIPTPTGATVHARATAQAGGSSLKTALVPSFSTTNAAIATVVPQTPGGGKTYSYKVVIVGTNGIRYAINNPVSTLDGSDDLSAANRGNTITLTGAIPNAATVEFYRVTAGGATTNTTGEFRVISIDAAGQFNSATPAVIDVGAVGTEAFNATSTNVLPVVTVQDGGGLKTLHATSVQIGLESNATVYWTMDGTLPSATNGFLMTQLPGAITFNLGGNETAWDNLRFTGTASMQCQFAYRQ